MGKNNFYIDQNKSEKILNLIEKINARYENLLKISISSTGIYDKLYTTGIVKNNTALEHSAVGISAKASGLPVDHKINDEYYKNLNFKAILGENGDCFDRFNVRAEEIKQSFEIITNVLNKLKELGFKEKNNDLNINLKDGYYIGKTEGHRGENIHLSYIENGKIKFYKIKDPSFANWSLLEYAVLNNIIADFPVCNKSFDLSYSGFDL